MAPVLSALLAAAVPTLVAASSPIALQGTEGLFQEFIEKFDRRYAPEEHTARLAVFAQNVQHIERFRLLDDGDAEYSHLTPFADLSVEEFAARNNLKASLWQPSPDGSVELLNVSALPASFDWREKGAVNPVKDQGGCGSCWAFATVANIEGAGFVTNKKLLSLSEQQLVDCDKVTGDEGCHGGYPSKANTDMVKNGWGLEPEQAYPYKGQDHKCQASQSQELAFITGWKSVSSDEDQMAAVLIQYGPLAMCLNGVPMQFYYGGIANPWSIFCNKKIHNHAVTLVGFGVASKQIYWTIRNSWGPHWGENGYYRLIRGTGACGMNTMVTTATGITFKASSSIVV